jgi:arylamine N-acetyltransferase
MINAKEAANAAIEYLKSFYSGAKNVTLEEVELSEEKKIWSITISFENIDPEDKNPTKINSTMYKIFRIDSTSGQVTAMKSRDYK